MGERITAIALAYICAIITLQTSQVQCEVIDMALTAFDDQYIECTKEMKSTMLSLLDIEKALDPDFKGAWEKASSEWESRKNRLSLPDLPQGFMDEHGIAILVYTDKNFPSPERSIPRRFNEAVRTSVTSLKDYTKSFHFKALHYYLTTALQLFQPECRLVYRGIHDVYFEPPKETNPAIRFGQFTSSSLNINTAKSFGQDSFFYITTCFGVDIGSLSTDQSESEVLIPGSEIFHVSNYTMENHQFILKSTKQRCHHYDCALYGGEKTSACNLYSGDFEVKFAP